MTVMEQDKLEEVNPARLPGLGTFPQGRSIQVFSVLSPLVLIITSYCTL